MSLSKKNEELQPAISATKIIKSRPWLSMQQMIKRSGRSCVRKLFAEDEKYDENSFNFDDVNHLYKLYKASDAIRRSSDIVIKTEIYPARIGRTWPYNHIIVPDFIRKKVNAFRTGNNDNLNSITSNNGKKQHGIYRLLLDSCGDKEKLILKINEIENEAYKSEFYIDYKILRQYSLKLSKSNFPTLMLFIYECRRLDLLNKASVITNILTIVNNKETLEKLGQCLFFSLLLPITDGDFSIDAFLYNKKRNVNIKILIDEFIKGINEKYLFTAGKRRKIRK